MLEKILIESHKQPEHDRTCLSDAPRNWGEQPGEPPIDWRNWPAFTATRPPHYDCVCGRCAQRIRGYEASFHDPEHPGGQTICDPCHKATRPKEAS